MFNRNQNQIVNVNELMRQMAQYGKVMDIAERISGLITASIEDNIDRDRRKMDEGEKLYEWETCLDPFHGTLEISRLADIIGYEMPVETAESLHEVASEVQDYLDAQKEREGKS